MFRPRYLALLAICRTANAGVAYDRKQITENEMNITLSAGPLAALIAGILILIVPRLLNYIVALYLILIGVLGLFGAYASHVV
jgi:hypothetical protein